MNTRKYPRTLEEAYGPHTSQYIHNPPDGLQISRSTLLAALICAVFVAVIIWGLV
jgi:hypothetical protein